MANNKPGRGFWEHQQTIDIDLTSGRQLSDLPAKEAVYGTTSTSHNSASSFEPSPSCWAAADLSTGQQTSSNPMNDFLPDDVSISPSSYLDDHFPGFLFQEVAEDIPWSSELPDFVRDDIKGRLSATFSVACKNAAFICPPFLQPLIQSSDGDQFTQNSFTTNTGSDGGLHSNYGLGTSSTEWTAIPSPNSEGNILPSTRDLADETLMFNEYDVPLSPDSKSCMYLVAPAQGLFCVNVGKALSPGKLVIYNPVTPQFKVLPAPLIHPVLMHLRVDGSGEYKVLIAGSAEDSSLISKVYSSITGDWVPCEGNLPCPPFGLHNQYQNGAYYKDSDRELLFCVAILDENCTNGILVYDLQKEKWLDSFKRPIPLVVRSSKSRNLVPRLITAHVIGCGGSIFVFSEQECGMDKQFYFHKLNPDSSENTSRWKEVIKRPFRSKKVEYRSLPRGLIVYPEFTCSPESATFVDCCGSVFVFSEQTNSIDNNVCICIHRLIPNDSGDGGKWDEIMRCKRTRHRGPSWKSEEINDFLNWMEQTVKADKSKPPWIFISEGLKRNGYNRGSKACEDLWGTLLKRRRDFQTFDQAKNATDIWYMNKTERAKNKLPRVFTSDWYGKMEKIDMVKKPRTPKKTTHAVNDEDNVSSITLVGSIASSSGLLAASDPLLSAPPASASLAHAVDKYTLVQGDDQGQVQGERVGEMTLLTSAVNSLDDLVARRDWTNEQMLEIMNVRFKEKVLQLEKDKLEFQKDQLQRNKGHEFSGEQQPKKRGRK